MFRTTTLVAGALCALAGATGAHAVTIVTFSDPASGAMTPLFDYHGGFLTGGWSAHGLTLRTPGLAAPDFPNATFTFTPLATVLSLGIADIMSGGRIDFFDDAHTPLLSITFANAVRTQSLSLGGSDVVGNSVTFSGPLLGGNTYDNEAFAFSFANPVTDPGGFTVTSAFTSSADLSLPTPGGAALLTLGAIPALRRRRV